MSCNDNKGEIATGCFPNVGPPQTSEPTDDTSALTDDTSITDSVKEYYGKVLQSKGDLKTGVCLARKGGTSELVKSARKLVHQDVQDRYYGCGAVIPDLLEGANMLDLGSGAGHDCFVLSKLVGQNGHVTGVDMTDEQIDMSRKYIDYHMKVFGYQKPNVEFVKGYIEKLEEAGVQTNFFDIIISNCVVNLSPDKTATLRSAFATLKEGGEMFFSDLYADQVLPEHVRKNKLLWGEGIAGALWWQDLYKICAEVGFSPPRLVIACRLDLKDPYIKHMAGDANYVAATYRLFKTPGQKEPASRVTYSGQIPHCTDQLILDHTITFKTGEPRCVSSEVASILKASRMSAEFSYESVEQCDCAQDERHDPFKYCEQAAQQTMSPCGEKAACS